MKNKLVFGVLWSVVEVIIKRVLDTVIKLILANLLFADDFGIIAMATVFISFIQVLNEAGMGLAIIQKKTINEKLLNTVFWSNLFWSIFLFIILSFLLAPIAASFYNQPILEQIIPVLSLSILMRALNTVHSAQLRRELHFKKLAFISNVSTFIGGTVAIVMAFLGFGVWCLVAYTLITYIITTPLYFNATKWKPKLQWDKSAFKEIISFGLYTTSTMMLLNIISNADYLLLGKWVSAAAVGIYSIAYMMTNQVSGQISTMVDRVMYPFYSSLQEDTGKIKEYYIKQVRYYVLALYPIMLTLLLFSSDIVLVFFGSQWEESILPLKILSLSVMISILTGGYNLLFRSIGKPKYEFKIQVIISVFIYLPCLISGIYIYGLTGAAIGILISRLISFFVHQYVLKKNFDIKIKNVLSNNGSIIILCFLMSLLVFGLRALNVKEVFIMVSYVLVFGFSYFMLFKSDFLKIVQKK